MVELASSVVDRLARSVRDWGVPDTVERALSKVATKAFSGGFRKRAVPTLHILCSIADVVYNDPDELLEGFLGIDKAQIATLRAEYDELKAIIANRYETHPLSYPRMWAVEDGSAFVLYAIVRTLSPATILETGVANGHSSFYFLHALSRNQKAGSLHSVDVANNVGSLLDSSEKAPWNLHLLSLAAPKTSFREVLTALPNLDIMIHDSDHSYRWMDFELEAALPKMSESGLIICDDTDANFAVIDFCRRHSLKPILFVETRKVLSLIRVPQVAKADVS